MIDNEQYGEEGPPLSTPSGSSTDADTRFFDSEEDAEAAAATCTYQGSTYNEGAIVCMGHKKYKCTKNGWVNQGFSC